MTANSVTRVVPLALGGFLLLGLSARAQSASSLSLSQLQALEAMPSDPLLPDSQAAAWDGGRAAPHARGGGTVQGPAAGHAGGDSGGLRGGSRSGGNAGDHRGGGSGNHHGNGFGDHRGDRHAPPNFHHDSEPRPNWNRQPMYHETIFVGDGAPVSPEGALAGGGVVLGVIGAVLLAGNPIAGACLLAVGAAMLIAGIVKANN